MKRFLVVMVIAVGVVVGSWIQKCSNDDAAVNGTRGPQSLPHNILPVYSSISSI